MDGGSYVSVSGPRGRYVLPSWPWELVERLVPANLTALVSRLDAANVPRENGSVVGSQTTRE